MLAIWSHPEEAPLSKIHIFEHGDLHMLYNRPLSAPRGLVGALFIRSLDLEELVICNIVDATHFFAACTRRRRIPISPLPWQRLRVLMMTSQDISSRKQPELINTLLSQAGRVAKQMPELRVMELYGVWRESAGVFRYLVTGNSAEISWVSTWEFKLGDEPKYIWWDVAQLREDRLVLQFAPERHLRTYDDPSHFVHQWLVTQGLAPHSPLFAALVHDNLPDPLRRILGVPNVLEVLNKVKSERSEVDKGMVYDTLSEYLRTMGTRSAMEKCKGLSGVVFPANPCGKGKGL